LPARPRGERDSGLLVGQSFEVPEPEELPGAFVVPAGEDVLRERLKSDGEPGLLRISSEPSTRSASFKRFASSAVSLLREDAPLSELVGVSPLPELNLVHRRYCLVGAMRR
jgi:hypothetical protein